MAAVFEAVCRFEETLVKELDRNANICSDDQQHQRIFVLCKAHGLDRQTDHTTPSVSVGHI